MSATRRAATGEITVACPHCGVRPVATGAKLEVIRGLLLVARTGTYWSVGCNECVQAQARREALMALLFGWWCFPWGLWTPVIVVQNLLASLRSDDRPGLEEALQHIGMSLEDVEVGPDGMTGRQRHLTAAFAQVVGRVAVASGQGSREWELACAAVSEFCSGALDRATVERWIRELGAESLEDRGSRSAVVESEADRLQMLRVAVEVALADGRLSASENAVLRQVCADLRLPLSLLAQLLDGLAAATADEQRQMRSRRAQALKVLGLSQGSSAAEIAVAHRRLMMRHHPDLVPPSEREEATQRAVALNQARDVLLVVRYVSYLSVVAVG